MATLSKFSNDEVLTARNIADNVDFSDMFDDWINNDPKLARQSMKTLLKLKQKCAVWFTGGIATGIREHKKMLQEVQPN